MWEKTHKLALVADAGSRARNGRVEESPVGKGRDGRAGEGKGGKRE